MSQVLGSLENKDPLDSRGLRFVCGLNMGATPAVAPGPGLTCHSHRGIQAVMATEAPKETG